MDFRKTFFPTEDELKIYEDKLQSLNDERKSYLKSLGFTDSDCIMIDNMESEEMTKLHKFQSYSSRYSLLQDGIITAHDVRRDIENKLGGTYGY